MAAFDTLYTTLEVLTRVTAPLLPLVAEEIWCGLTGGRSVHLTDWPDAASLPGDDALVAGMDRAREVCSAVLGLRKAAGLRTRLPLGEVTVVMADPEQLLDYAAIIADEVNVRTVALRDIESATAADFGVSQRLTVNARAAGPRLGGDVQKAIRGVGQATGRSPRAVPSSPAASCCGKRSTPSRRWLPRARAPAASRPA